LLAKENDRRKRIGTGKPVTSDRVKGQMSATYVISAKNC